MYLRYTDRKGLPFNDGTIKIYTVFASLSAPAKSPFNTRDLPLKCLTYRAAASEIVGLWSIYGFPGAAPNAQSYWIKSHSPFLSYYFLSTQHPVFIWYGRFHSLNQDIAWSKVPVTLYTIQRGAGG